MNHSSIKQLKTLKKKTSCLSVYPLKSILFTCAAAFLGLILLLQNGVGQIKRKGLPLGIPYQPTKLMYPGNHSGIMLVTLKLGKCFINLIDCANLG